MVVSIPSTMKALLQPDMNSTEITLITRGVPTPNFDKNEHLIRVLATAPCPGELLWTKDFGALFPSDPDNPKILTPCCDLCGTIVSAPPSSPFRTGDRVYARTNFARTGNAAEYAIGITEELALAPKNLTDAEAASVSLSALTAWQLLFEQAGLGDFSLELYKGKRVLVTAASGSVGAWVVQLAKLAGAEVVGTSGPDNIDFVKSLGASEVMDYRSADLKAWADGDGKKVDVVIDCVGRKSLEDAWWTLKDGGILISIFQPPEPQRPVGYTGQHVTALFYIMHPDGASLATLSPWLANGRVKPIVDSVYPLERYEEAFARLDSGHARGKVIFDLTL
jgi:NADPH:quinone reductase-like Zn-dependent oxidoreductase